MRKTAFVVKPFLYLLLLGFTSCGVWDFFAAYFNTYYNAKRLYDEAVDEVWAMPETRETGRNMLTLPPIGQSTRTKFTSVIEKCSKLLQYHPESNLVDDALLMIGRSYFYQADYQQADRKFNELIEGYPESNLVPETRVLQAYAYYRIQDFKQAEALAARVYEQATAAGDSRTIADISLLLGQLALDAKQYRQAREYYLKVGEMGDPADKRAQALLKVGEMFSEEGDYRSAEQAYRRARSLSGSYIGEYRGSFGAAWMKAKQGEYETALNALIDLRENANYREFFGEVDVEIGNVYRDKGDLEAAIDQYHYVDTAYARSESAASANYALGMIYENTLHLYDSAKVAYDKARNAPPQSLLMPQIVRKGEYLGRYLQYSAEVHRLDSTLKVAVAYADSVSRAKTLAPHITPDSGKSGPRGAVSQADSATMAKMRDSGQTVAQAVAQEHAAPDHIATGPDTSMAPAMQEVSARPSEPPTGVNAPLPAEEGRVQPGAVPPPPGDEPKGLTGRAARTRGRIARAGEEAAKAPLSREGEAAVPAVRADSLKPQAPAQPPDNPDSVRKHLAVAIDNLAGVFYVSMGKPDSARVLYRRLAGEFAGSQLAPRALYVLARIEGEDSTTSSTVSDSLYRVLIERYPTSAFANEARRLIGIPAVENVSDMAEGSYARAAQLLKSGKPLAAIDTFTTLARTFPQSPAASRALYAAGWTYEHQTLLRDSAAALYERLVSRYPNTIFAQRVQPRVLEVQNARRLAQEKARADSLAKAKPPAPAASDTVKAKARRTASAAPDTVMAKADSLAKARHTAPAASDTVKAKARHTASAAPDTMMAKADSLAKARHTAPAALDTAKAKADSPPKGKPAAPAVPDTASPAGKPTAPTGSPEKKPID